MVRFKFVCSGAASAQPDSCKARASSATTPLSSSSAAPQAARRSGQTPLARRRAPGKAARHHRRRRRLRRGVPSGAVERPGDRGLPCARRRRRRRGDGNPRRASGYKRSAQLEFARSARLPGWNSLAPHPQMRALRNARKADRHVHPPRQARQPIPSHPGGRRRQAAPRLRLRRHLRFRSVPDDGRFPQRSIRATIVAGFPWHPHRGIETITYVLAGSVEHGDSLGNRGVLGAGDVQWMTAGQRHPPPGNAEGRHARPHARLPALGQPARRA